MGNFKISDGAKDKGKEKESKKSKTTRLKSRKDLKGKEKLKEKAVPAEYGTVAKKRKAVQAETAAAQACIIEAVKIARENGCLPPYPGSMTALRQYEENCSDHMRRFGLLRAVAQNEEDGSTKTDLNQVRTDLDRDLYPYATKMSAAKELVPPPGVERQQLDQLLHTLAVGYSQGTADLLSYLCTAFPEGRFKAFQIVVAKSELFSGSVFPRDLGASVANLASLSSGFEIAYMDDENRESSSIMDGDKRSSFSIPGEYFFTAKTHPEGGFEILSYHSTNALLKAILEYTPIRNEDDKIVYYPPLTVYDIQIVDKNGIFSKENLQKAIAQAQDEEAMAAKLLESGSSKFKSYCEVQALEPQKKLLDSILRLTQKHAALKDHSYRGKLEREGAAVTLDTIMLSSIYRDLPQILSGEKKIGDCPMLLKTIIWCGVPELTQALKEILAPNPLKRQELTWLLELYGSGDNTAELAQVWLDLRDGPNNQELNKQYAHALLQQPKMSGLKESLEPLLAPIRASHSSEQNSIKEAEDKINLKIIARMHQPDTDWSLLSEILSAIEAQEEEEKEGYADLLAVWFGVKRMQDCPRLLWTVVSSKDVVLQNKILNFLHREDNSALSNAFGGLDNIIRFYLVPVINKEKKIEDYPYLLEAIVLGVDPNLAQTLKAILEPVVGKEKLAWLLQLYSSNARYTAELVHAWLDADSPNKDPQQTKGYLDILLQQPNMEPLKAQVGQLHTDITEGVSKGIITAKEATTLENDVNQEIVHCVHQSLTQSEASYEPAAGWDELKKEVEPAVKTPRGKWASRILMGLGIALGIGCLVGLGLASGGVIPAAFAVGGILISVLPSALVGSAISCAMISAGFSLHSWRNHKIRKNEMYQNVMTTTQDIKKTAPEAIQSSFQQMGDLALHHSPATDSASEADSSDRSHSPLLPATTSVPISLAVSSSSSSSSLNPARSRYSFHNPNPARKETFFSEEILENGELSRLFSLNFD